MNDHLTHPYTEPVAWTIEGGAPVPAGHYRVRSNTTTRTLQLVLTDRAPGTDVVWSGSATGHIGQLLDRYLHGNANEQADAFGEAIESYAKMLNEAHRIVDDWNQAHRAGSTAMAELGRVRAILNEAATSVNTARAAVDQAAVAISYLEGEDDDPDLDDE